MFQGLKRSPAKTLLTLPLTFLQDKNREDKTETISIEELIEQKRAELSAQANLTPVTIQSFIQWKKRKMLEKAEKARQVNHSLVVSIGLFLSHFVCFSKMLYVRTY